MSKYRGRFGHFQGQPEMFSNNLLARSRRALAYRGQNVGNRCLWRVLENLRNRAVSRPFFCIFDRFIPKNRQLRAPTHSVRSIQLGIERDISSTGFRHPNENWGHYAPVPNASPQLLAGSLPPRPQSCRASAHRRRGSSTGAHELRAHGDTTVTRR